MLQKSNFSSLSPRLDWMYKVRDTFWWIVQKTDLVFGQICRNWTLSFWPTDRACSQTYNFHPFSVLRIHKENTNITSFANESPQLMVKSWRSSPYAIKDVDEDEEECDEHCHPESESETSASCINVPKIYRGRLPIKEQCPLPSKWNCSVSGSMQLVFESFWINAADIWEKHSLSLVDFVVTVIDSKIES